MTQTLRDYENNFERMLDRAGFCVIDLMKIDKVLRAVCKNLEIGDLSSRYDPITRAQIYERHVKARMPLFASFLISSGRSTVETYTKSDHLRERGEIMNDREVAIESH